jgi:hypothetical protein
MDKTTKKQCAIILAFGIVGVIFLQLINNSPAYRAKREAQKEFENYINEIFEVNATETLVTKAEFTKIGEKEGAVEVEANFEIDKSYGKNFEIFVIYKFINSVEKYEIKLEKVDKSNYRTTLKLYKNSNYEYKIEARGPTKQYSKMSPITY